MRGYTGLIAVNLKLALRERVAVFFNYVFPLIFFFVFGQILGAARGGVITQVVTMVLVVGILGNGLFGGGIRAVQDREQNILRRFKVAPISPLPILTASIVTGWVLYLPAVVLTLVLARIVYGMAMPSRLLSLLVLVSVGVIAFRAIGLIIASVANSAQESQIMVQLVYLPMLFLTGATFPMPLLPGWAQTLAQFLPGTHLVTALQGIMIRSETAAENWQPILVLLATTVVATFLSAILFRWEKGERMRTSAKLYLVAMVLPSLVFGAYHAYSREQMAKTRALYRDMMRSRNLLVRGGRLFAGDGRVLDPASVLIRGGRIDRIFAGLPPDAASVNAEVLEATGRTVMPGLIDVRVSLGEAGAPFDPPAEHALVPFARRALASYVYCGVTAVRTVGSPARFTSDLQHAVASGELLGAELFACGTSTDAAGCEPGSTLDRARRGYSGAAAYVPSLAALDGLKHLFTRNPALIDHSLVRQVSPPALIRGARMMLEQSPIRPPADWQDWVELANRSLLKAHAAGVPLATGSDAGSPFVFQGPSVQHELRLWVSAGIPPGVALQAATRNAAHLLGAANRIGLIREGFDANLLILDGNPLKDIGALERISDVIFKGERVDRRELLDQQWNVQVSRR
jgi:imidazolonepropionase-like amidohydrolase/ABC-type multidrug transport system permease subunit